MSRSPDLYGWDTAFALRVADFNRLIAAQTDTQARVHPTADVPGASRVTWTFGPWRIVAAVGSQITISMPLQPGSVLTIASHDMPLTGCACVVTTEMVFKPLDTPGTTPTSVLTASSGMQDASA